MSEGDKLMKRYGDRVAYEWYVKWRLLDLERRMTRKNEELRKETQRKTAELVAASTAVSVTISLVTFVFLRHKKL